MDMNENKVRKKRHRITVVCTNCKKRKSKCDRGKPCSNCTRIGIENSCLYIKDTPSLPIDSIGSVADLTASELQIPNFIPIHPSYNKEYVNYIPNGRFFEIKRSAYTMFPIFTDACIEHRDAVIKAFTTFRTIVVKKTIDHYRKTGIDIERIALAGSQGLPKSFLPLTVFDEESSKNLVLEQQEPQQSYQIHSLLAEKFSHYRKNANLKLGDDSTTVYHNLIIKSLPDLGLLMDTIIPYYEQFIEPLVPIIEFKDFNVEIQKLYAKIELSNSLDPKIGENTLACIILLICRLCHLSSKFAVEKSINSSNYESILNMDTNIFVSLVQRTATGEKPLRKGTLYELQLLIMLRLCYWVGPDDGDGQQVEQSEILHGAIVSMCKHMGVWWDLVKYSEDSDLFITVDYKAVPKLGSQSEYIKLFRKIWCYVLCWDRKMMLLTGQECEIGRSYKMSPAPRFGNGWCDDILQYDYLLYGINNELHDDARKVDISMLEELVEMSEMRMGVLKEDDFSSNIYREQKLSLMLMKLNIIHGQLSWYERTGDKQSQETAYAKLFTLTVELGSKCVEYFSTPGIPEQRFYMNKIYEVILNRLNNVIVPGLILRIRYEEETGLDGMVKYLYGMSSMYFNEIGKEYYRTFKKMFHGKINYKILENGHRCMDMIIKFLQREMQNNNDTAVSKGDSMKLSDRLPLVAWDSNSTNDMFEPIHTVPRGPEIAALILEMVNVSDRYHYNNNVFQTVYKEARLVIDETTTTSQQDSLASAGTNRTNNIATNSGSGDDGGNGSDDSYLMRLIQELFDPLDFASAF
ncbi:hypothetical protein Kpol_2001p16 [Vanderwaltozyma polyspora DSM 70294]|uniref:Oleate activated transcription factor 3 n=1 Tax=Vanderwaltozyma polyspora (strain ATCC 22028 / DSM 70294 / BCRC 21397 / CBS 2163 / NBRC 10782 / NRRL Y-8283 / UCD 57-17) TaxID=436907 RepID=OAF3_VANPO|nr:uncharacterized protein Kpol_2001p16 [Vanderwaltozyma polyspora DSM 70294]A7TGQ2.1 RecName: Full=Oleate activated transcription factor 3 [Vanderwaltozyma polyspora DSM 70294]EDO18515.1 hypothetical protein Kpol_2001p16 [Vanderwaltozyma polyspora DSM 70294]